MIVPTFFVSCVWCIVCIFCCSFVDIFLHIWYSSYPNIHFGWPSSVGGLNLHFQLCQTILILVSVLSYIFSGSVLHMSMMMLLRWNISYQYKSKQIPSYKVTHTFFITNCLCWTLPSVILRTYTYDIGEFLVSVFTTPIKIMPLCSIFSSL